MPVSVNLDAILDPEFQNSAIADLVTAPVSAFAGVSDVEAEGLRQAFGIETIGDLAGNPLVQAALAIRDMAQVAEQPPLPG